MGKSPLSLLKDMNISNSDTSHFKNWAQKWNRENSVCPYFYFSGSAKETQAFGEEIGRKLSEGDVVALIGELGAGKTCLAQGLGWGLGIDRSVYLTSPSFTLIKEYQGRIPVYHIDLFRLDSVEEADELLFQDYLYSGCVTIIEWPEKIEALLPAKHLRIEITIISENERNIKLTQKENPYAVRIHSGN